MIKHTLISKNEAYTQNGNNIISNTNITYIQAGGVVVSLSIISF